MGLARIAIVGMGEHGANENCNSSERKFEELLRRAAKGLKDRQCRRTPVRQIALKARRARI